MAEHAQLAVQLELRKGHLEVLASGPYSRQGVFELIDRIGHATQAQGAARVLLDIGGVSGDPPDLDRFEYGVHAAQTLGRLERLAVLGDSQFRVTHLFEDAARNRGLPVRVFRDRGQAIAWLDAG